MPTISDKRDIGEGCVSPSISLSLRPCITYISAPFVLRSLQGTIEEKIYQRQIAKQGLSGTVADARNLSKVEFSLEDLKVTVCINVN